MRLVCYSVQLEDPFPLSISSYCPTKVDTTLSAIEIRVYLRCGVAHLNRETNNANTNSSGWQ